MRAVLTEAEIAPITTNGGGRYYEAPAPLEFIDTGSTLLNHVVGGGWPLTRISNVVGDKSTGKTLLAIEATNAFVKQFPEATPRYRESEAAFDQEFAAKIGMPVERVDFGEQELNTVEDFYDDLNDYLKSLNKQPGLYILDSLDALSSSDELKRDFGDGSYGTGKAKDMGKLLRMLVREVKRSRTHLMIISQERDNIGVMFGKRSTRSGGRALDFYASQVLWLAKKGNTEITRGGVKRPVGVEIKAKCEKNKIAIPLRQCDFNIRFNFGIDDITSCLDWLEEVKMLDAVTSLKRADYDKFVSGLTDEEYWQKVKEVGVIAAEAWLKVEERFAPERKRV
jgi:recombination protein RecA